MKRKSGFGVRWAMFLSDPVSRLSTQTRYPVVFAKQRLTQIRTDESRTPGDDAQFLSGHSKIVTQQALLEALFIRVIVNEPDPQYAK
jgi:hypothetical protein